MQQHESTEKTVGIGNTTLNCKLSLGHDVVLPIAYALKDIMLDSEYRYLIKNHSSMIAFSMLDAYKDRMVGIKTRHGVIVATASGVSKTALIMRNDIGTMFVIKYGRTPYNKKNESYVVARLNTNNDWKQQVINQVATWDRFKGNREVIRHLLPCFKHFKNMNVVIEPYAEYVGNAKNHVSIQERADFMEAMNNIGLRDMHSGNIGIFNGKLVAIDYAI